MGGAISGIFLGAWLVVPLWTFFDAEERGRNGILWALITLVVFPFFPVGLVVYAIMLGRDESSGLSPGSARPPVSVHRRVLLPPGSL